MRIRKLKDGRYAIIYKDKDDKDHKLVTEAKTPNEAMKIAKLAKIPEMEQLAQVKALSHKVYRKLTGDADALIADKLEDWLPYAEARTKSFENHKMMTYYMRRWMAWLHEEHPSILYVSQLRAEHFQPHINTPKFRYGNRNMTRKFLTKFVDFLHMHPELEVFVYPKRDFFVDWKSMTHAQKIKKVVRPFTPEQFYELTRKFEIYLKDPWGGKNVVHPYKSRLVKKHQHEIRQFWQHAIQIAYWAGLRISDVCALQWSMLDGNELTVQTMKTGRWIALPLEHPTIGSGVLLDVFASIPRREDSEYVFPSYAGLARNRSRLCKYFQETLERMGMPGHLSFHSLRHSFICRLNDEGVDIYQIARLVGHGDIDTTKGYMMK